MVLKGIKNSLKKNCQKKLFSQKKNSMKKQFGQKKFVSITSMLDCMGQSPSGLYGRLLFVRDITITSALIGYCLYGTLLLRPRSACPIQIRAHHHIDVYTDINKQLIFFQVYLGVFCIKLLYTRMELMN